jgi:AraC family transcriptional regulator
MGLQPAGPSEPHNLGAAHVSSYCWSGITVHSIHMEMLPGRSWHQLSGDQPILSIVVNEAGGRCEPRSAIGSGDIQVRKDRQRPVGHMSLIPAGMPVWGYSDQIAQVDEVRLILDVDRVFEIMGEEFQARRLAEPQLMFFDDSLQALARLLTLRDEASSWTGLFGDGLVVAMVARLSGLGPGAAQTHRRLGLTQRQLQQVTDFIRDNLAQPIRLSELATLAGLSASQFGRAFKTSTGTTPHKWQLDARIESAKRMLSDGRSSLIEIALDAGFSEQSHFSRTFRAATGASPSAWRRANAA